MKIAFVGCGYVFDIYMRTRWAHPEIEISGVFDVDVARSAVVQRHYGLMVYPDLESLLGDPDVEIVVNLTTIASHFDITRRALSAGKNVYTEKPITTELAQTRELFALAERSGRILTAAPCNLHCDAITSIWRAINEGAIGKPALIYAELDDNPAHLMRLETVESPTGAPFPYREELQEGCTIEHVGYHLAWICAIFGPAIGVTAFSKFLIPDKTAETLTPSDTPDVSVACLNFAGGVAARITCSWVAPRDHSLRVIGREGELRVDNVFHDQSAVHLERFSRVSLTARKAYSVRRHPIIGRLFGVGGQRMKLLRRWKSYGVEAEKGVGSTLKHKLVSWLRRKEIYAQDKLLGVAEMCRAIESGRPQPMQPDFLIHLNELTLMISAAGPGGTCMRPATTFDRFDLSGDYIGAHSDYRNSYRLKLMERFAGGIVDATHRK